MKYSICVWVLWFGFDFVFFGCTQTTYRPRPAQSTDNTDVVTAVDSGSDADTDTDTDADVDTNSGLDAGSASQSLPTDWLHSHDAELVRVQNGTIEWTPRKPHTILLSLTDEKRLKSIGDFAEFRYQWKSNGDGNISGCTDLTGDACRDGCSECPMKGSDHPCHQIDCDHDDDITCLAGTGDFRIGLFDSGGNARPTDHGYGETNAIFTGYGISVAFSSPHLRHNSIYRNQGRLFR